MHTRLFALAFALALAAPALAAPPDWAKWAEIGTVEVVTSDEDGDSRTTKVWIVVLDGQAYVRTGGTRWGDNVERAGKLELRGDPGSLALRAEKIADEVLKERVVAAFHEKYGFSDTMSGLFRFGETRIFRLGE
jgi:hypothetical protein